MIGSAHDRCYVVFNKSRGSIITIPFSVLSMLIQTTERPTLIGGLRVAASVARYRLGTYCIGRAKDLLYREGEGMLTRNDLLSSLHRRCNFAKFSCFIILKQMSLVVSEIEGKNENYLHYKISLSTCRGRKHELVPGPNYATKAEKIKFQE